MRETRAQLFLRLLELVGRDQFANPVASDGWPGRVSLIVRGEPIPCAIFVGPLGLSHRNRDERERRFQNPAVAREPGEPAGKPIIVPPKTVPLLLGISDEYERPVIIAADPIRRAGHTSRYSIFAPRELLAQTAKDGWAERTNSDGELLTGFWPELLPKFVDIRRATVLYGPEQADE